MSRRGLCAALSLLALLLCGARAEADPLASFSRRLAAAGKQVRTLQASFVQRKRLALFRTEVTSKGRVYFSRPNRLRWEILPPDASVLLVLGQRARLSAPGEKPRVMDLSRNKTMGALVDQLLVWLGVRPAADLSRWYRVKLKAAQGNTDLHLTPRPGPLAKRIKTIELRFGADLSLRRIHLAQTDGDSTTIQFSGYQRNAPIPAKSFK